MAVKTVKDIMIPLSQYVSILEDNTLKDALVALRKSHLSMSIDQYYHRAVLVKDNNGKIVGKLGYLGILAALDPQYDNLDEMKQLAGSGITKEDLRREMRDLGFWNDKCPLIKKRADEIKMNQVMVKFDKRIEEDRSLAEAMHIMANQQILSLLTTREGKTTGVIRLSDLFEEMTNYILSEE